MESWFGPSLTAQGTHVISALLIPYYFPIIRLGFPTFQLRLEFKNVRMDD
ncbi:protein of unknown function [Paenibacillus alvei]|uniref:Uncharacterized protein n=1 Tax=Paenibacillus alvei TaxID=44250 RepID=A0A383RJ70_PAEAL|nr:protein of unknown function [Paenibacillus alvei]